METELRINEKGKRFEMEKDGLVAYVDYSINKDILSLEYIYAPPPLRGTGIAENLATRVLEYAREKGMKIKVYCSWIAGFIHRNPEYVKLLDKSW